ncbi:MAG: ABC transporter permease [Euryarchaeota archaeon]|nr:ABC transporter permease [Euryarchaeota archaeon]MCD6158922.1 ABC transporter permease [Euryarchaeota archaeon]
MREEVFWKVVKARAYPRVISIVRAARWTIGGTIVSLFYMAALVLIYKSINAPPEYYSFAILGSSLLSYWDNVIWSMAMQLYWDKEDGLLELYMIAPMNRMALLTGMALGGMTMTSVRAIMIFIVGILLFKAPVVVQNPFHLMFAFFLALVALYGVGMAFASLFLMWGRQVWAVADILMEPVYTISGSYFPIKSLGYSFAFVASIIPLTFGLDAVRQAMFGSTWGLLPLPYEELFLAVYGVFYILLARYALRKMEYLAKVEGKLTLRWQ